MADRYVLYQGPKDTPRFLGNKGLVGDLSQAKTFSAPTTLDGFHCVSVQIMVNAHNAALRYVGQAHLLSGMSYDKLKELWDFYGYIGADTSQSVV